MVHTFDPSRWEAEAGGSEFEDSLVLRVSSRTARKPRERRGREGERERGEREREYRLYIERI